MKNRNADYIYTEAGKKSQSLKSLWSVYSFHWPLFLICIVVCLSVAVFYVRNITPIYFVKAKVSIKDSKKNPSEAKAALEELDILQTPKVIENEVAIIKSRPLMRKVVQQLGLTVNYQAKFQYRYKDLYTASPVRLKFIKPAKTFKKQEFEIRISSLRYFSLIRKNGTLLILPFNRPLISKIGSWQLDFTPEIKKYIGKTIKIQVKDMETAVSQYQNTVSIVLDRTAPLISLQIDDVVPERGVDILNHLIAAYKTINIEDKNRETERTLKFIDDRLASLTGELTNAEKNVENYKSSIGLTDISSQSKLFLDNVQTNDVHLNEVSIQLDVINGIEAYLNSSNAANVPATIGIADPGLVSLVEQLSRLQLQRNRLLAITPEDNPIFVSINEQIISTKAAVKNKVTGIKASLIRTKNQLKSFSSTMDASIKNIPGQERQYISIKRQQGIKENLYIYLLQKREEIALSYASTLTDARTVEEAYFEDPESSLKYPVAIALFCGLLLPVGLIYGRNTLRDRVMTRDDIEMETSAPVICELIHSEDKNSIVVLNHQSYAIGEQLRSLRTNLLQVYNHKGKGKVTLFTSSIAGEGKSFVTSNIGASLAASGKKTIILELDLRKPKISKIFNIDISRPGLSDYLNEEATKEEIIQPSNINPNLFVMRSGTVPFNPSELLQSKQMEILIDELRNEYDNVLIDTPPLRLVTDGMILAPLCDVCLYIVRHNFTPKSELPFIEQIYQSNKLKNMNLVFNGVYMDQRFGYSLDYNYYTDNAAKHTYWNSVFGRFFARF